MSNSDGSSDVCSSDLRHEEEREQPPGQQERRCREADQVQIEMEQAPQGGLSPDRDVRAIPPVRCGIHGLLRRLGNVDLLVRRPLFRIAGEGDPFDRLIHARSEAHTSALQSLMRPSYSIFCLKTKNRISILY